MGFLSAFKAFPSGQHPVEKFSAIISGYLRHMQSSGGSVHDRNMTLIARSAASPVARAIALHAQDLACAEISLRIILAKLTPPAQLAEMASALAMIRPGDRKGVNIRYLHTPALLNAHEQLVIGTSICWTGDMLRRPEENRNGLDLLEQNAPSAVALAELAFDALWAGAKPVSERALAGRSLFASPEPIPAALAAELAATKAGRRVLRNSVTRH